MPRQSSPGRRQVPQRTITDDHDTCAICGDPTPTGARGQTRLTCDKPECASARSSYAVSRRASTIQARREQLTGQRVCEGPCGRTLPLTTEHFPPSSRRDGHEYLRRWCRDCYRPKARAAHRKWEQSLTEHPAAHARLLEANRLRRNLHRLDTTGQPPGRRDPAAASAYLAPNSRDRMLDVEPLRAWLEHVVAREAPDLGRPSTGGHTGLESIADREGTTVKGVAAMLGVTDRAISRIRRREYATVSLAVADRLLTNYGRPVLIPARDLEHRLEAWAQELPGNGTRLLRYLDRAEQVAHLADMTLERLEDLWPELDD